MKTDKSQRINFTDYYDEKQELHQTWAGGKTKGQVATYFRQFREHHVGEILWIQMGVVKPHDFDNRWLRYWYGVVVKIFADHLAGGDIEYTEEVLRVFFPATADPESIKNIYGIFGFATKEYISNCLKVFFKDKFDEATGLPLKKSFAKEGNIGEREIKERLPYIQRWASEHLDLYVPDFGEHIDTETGEITEYNNRKDDPEYDKLKIEEEKLWSKSNDSTEG